MREFTEREIIAKYLGRVFGVLSKYTHNSGFKTRMQSSPLAVLAELQLRALHNGEHSGSIDDMFVGDCLNRINPDDNFHGLTAEEYSILSLNFSIWCGESPTAPKLIEHLQDKGYTQQQIAESIGVSLSTIQRWATDKAAPEKAALRRLMTYYNNVA